MRASTIMLVAVFLFMVHRWASNAKTLDARTVVEGAFAVGVIALLDQGDTEPVARGFAWLFLLVAAYAVIPDIGKVTAAPAASKTWTSVLQPKGKQGG